MPSPSSSTATLRPDIQGSFMEFDSEMDQRGYIGQRVFPVMEVASQAGTFGKVTIESLLKEAKTDRAPGSGYSRSDYNFTPVTYACEEHGHEGVVDDRHQRMYADYFEAETLAAIRTRAVVLRNYEKRVAAAVFNATTWASYTTGVSTEWSTPASAVPLTDVETAVQAVYSQCGLWPNALIVSKKVYRNLRNVDQIIDRVKYQNRMDVRAGEMSASALSQAFDLEVIVGGGTKNSANEGQNASPTQIWDDEYAMVCVVANDNDIETPCIGRTFHWAEDGSSTNGTVEMYREESKRGQVVRVRQDVDELVLHVECGHLLSNITA